MVGESLIGIGLAIMSGVSGTMGKQFIGLSARMTNESRAKCVFSLGMFLATILGAFLNAAAFGFAPQSVIAPFNGLEIALNILVAPCILEEKLTLLHVLGTMFVAAGAVLTAMFGPHAEKAMSWEQLQGKFFRLNVLIYMAVFGCWLLACRYVIQKGGKSRARGIALAAAAGSIAGNVCFIKCTVTLLRFSFGGDLSPWSHWLSYVLVAGAFTVAISSVKLMVKALQEYEAIFVVTLFGGSNIVMACISGDVVMTELEDHSVSGKLLYWASVLAIMAGLLIINVSFETPPSEMDDLPELPNLGEEEEPGFTMGHVTTMAEVVATKRRAPVVWANPFVGVATVHSHKMTRAMTVPARRRINIQQLTEGRFSAAATSV